MSMKPGETISPFASTMVSAGCGPPSPTDTMRSPAKRTVPARNGAPVPSAICAPTIAHAPPPFCASSPAESDDRTIVSAHAANAAARRLLNARLHDRVFGGAQQLTVRLLHHRLTCHAADYRLAGGVGRPRPTPPRPKPGGNPRP